MRSCSDVHNYLLEEGVQHEIIHLPALSRTPKQAAELLGVPLAEVVKSLLFVLDGRPTLVLVPGDRAADPELLRAVTGCAEVALARGKQVLDVTGYRSGAVPPCGLATDLPVVADRAVFESPIVYCGGGTTAAMLKLRSRDLRRLVKPRVASVAGPRLEG